MTASSPADLLAQQAEEAAENDADKAAALAREALAADPANARAANVLGVLAYAHGRLAEAQVHLDRACALPGADDDMRENAERVRGELGPLGYDPSSTRLGRAWAAGGEPAVVARLAEIPSATTPGERNLIRQYVAELWDGTTDVFENGPLLGGTTRALALGMLANTRRDPQARLHTYDWFNSKIPLDVPPEAFEDLVARGSLDPQARAQMDRTGSFKPVFDDLHAGHDYSGLVVSHTGALPGSPADESTMDDLFEPEPGSTWGLLLVDGCKSWYGTRYFMERTADAIPAGSHMLFQDYGWYTCFWLTALVGLFPDRFKLIAHTATTYGFELTKAIGSHEVGQTYPAAPSDLGEAGIDDLYTRMLRDAEPLADAQLTVALTIHHAGALAYIGAGDRARAIIDDLATQPFAAAFGDVIQRARRSPTYTPDAPVEL